MADGEKSRNYVTVRVSDSDLRRVEQLRHLEDRSRSAMARKALRVGLDVLEGKKDRKR